VSSPRQLACIALIGDRSEEITAHVGIERSFELADKVAPVEYHWIPTDRCQKSDLSVFTGVWCVPGSPYRSMDGALSAIQCAREQKMPFLGTCGGFQHALLEYARNVVGLTNAEHAETSPDSAAPLISRLSCSLAEGSGLIRLTAGTRLQQIYAATEVTERYNCNFGLNPKFENLLRDSELVISARDENGEVRAFELARHPFFIGTLFQPERQALRGSLHPIIRAFIETARSAASR
jgi:CTP synthase (UTP-ammonia lyase)